MAKLKPVENKMVLTPEELEVYAEANAAKNGTTPEEEKKKIQSEILGKGSWALEEGGPAQKVLQDATGKENPTQEDIDKALKETAEQRLTREQMGAIAQGNQGDDHVNNPNALDTADITKLGKKQLASVQTEDNMNPGTYSISNDDRIQMMKDAGISPEKIENEVNTTMSDSVSEAVTPKENDSPKQSEAKGKYNKSMMSIWDAYRNGDIDKETAGYFTIDAIATLAKNLGRSIGNVGAQFSGGTIDNGHDTSKWEQRSDSMFNTELQKETEGIDTFENKFKQLSYNRNSTINDLMKAIKSDAEKLSDDNPLKIAYLSLAAMIANGNVDGTTTLAATGAKGITEFLNLFKEKDKK